MSNANEPAYPEIQTRPAWSEDDDYLYAETYSVGGLTKRERAAIDLRVPMSGDDDIDAMIRAANRKDFAAMAMQGLCANTTLNEVAVLERVIREIGRDAMTHAQVVAKIAADCADDLLAELERTA